MLEATYTQMKWSDSRVNVWNEMEAGWMPSAVSCTASVEFISRPERWSGVIGLAHLNMLGKLYVSKAPPMLS